MISSDHFLFKSLKMSMKYQLVPRQTLRLKAGQYHFADKQKVLHPLEIFLIVDHPLSGDWIADLEAVLGVSAAWIRGFNVGFAGEEAGEEGGDYLEAFTYGKEIFEKKVNHPGVF